MDFLSDYWLYNSCYEIPRNYAFWSGIGLISATMNRKLCYMHGDLEIHSMMYIGLIGPPNQKKSTSCDFARAMFETVCPDLKVGPSRTSPEKIVQLMAASDFERCFTNHLGESMPVRPYVFFINEFKNFLGRGPLDMINFLTDIYDRKRYPSATLCRGVEDIINPSVVILMCETPSWFISNMRGDLITGGIARRFVICYETDASEAHPFITITAEARAAWERVKQRMVDVRKLSGLYTWGSAVTKYDKWYRDNHARAAKESNMVMKGYLGSKAIQLFKVMMCLDIVRDKPMMCFDADLLDTSLALLDSIEHNMPKLSMASGRNEVMGAQIRLMDLLEEHGGWMLEVALKKAVETEFRNPNEIYSVMRYLEGDGRIIKKQLEVPSPLGGKPIVRYCIFTPERWLKWELEKNVQTKPKETT